MNKQPDLLGPRLGLILIMLSGSSMLWLAGWLVKVLR